jgi:flavin-dependent dehydrogenase
MVNSLVDGSATKVAIVGSGPAGATLGALLARKGASVAMFDDGARPPLIVGESLVPQMVPIFRRLGIEEQVAAIGVYKPGVLVTFGAQDELLLSFTAARGVLPTYAYNVPRKEFDDLLNKTAVAAGVRYVECAAKLEMDKADSLRRSRVLLAEETLAHVPEWSGQPDLVIDASGRRRIFAKLLGVNAAVGKRKDVSHFAHFENCPWPEPKGIVMTIRMSYGWAWRIPLPGPKVSIGVVLNKDDAKKFGSTPEEQLEKIIANEPRLGGDCPDRRRLTPVATFANYQLVSECGSGANWAMVGDAFGFVDPMLSPGLCMAMVSAEKLADVIPARGVAAGRLAPRLTRYWKWFRVTLGAWQNLVDHFYDGRIFAIQRTGLDMSKRYPGRLSDVMERHIEKNLSGMATGAFINRPYSRWLLSMLSRHGIRGHNPQDFAVR